MLRADQTHPSPRARIRIVPEAEFDPTNNVVIFSDYEFFVNPGGGFFRLAVSGTLVVKNRPDGTQVWQLHATF